MAIMGKHISITDILKQSGKFNIVNVVSNGLAVPKSIIIAMVLAPKDYGIISFLGLWLTYAALINPGLLSASTRKMAHLIGSNDNNEVLRAQNISLTSDLLYSLLPFLVILLVSLFVTDRVIKIGFILTAFTYAISHLASCWRGMNFVRQKFSLVAKSDLIQAVITTLSVIAFIYWLKIYAVLIGPIIGAFFAAWYYWRKGKINFHFSFDWVETKRLFKVGIIFSSLALVYWGYQLIDRTIVAGFLPFNTLGIYSYAAVYTSLGSIFFRDFGNVLAPVLWTKAGESKDSLVVFRGTKRIMIYLAVITAVLIPFFQLCFYFLTHFLTKKFIASIPIFIILSCNLYLVVLAIIPSLVLQSSVVNKQTLSLKAYIIGLALNIGLDILAIRMGYGIFAIALINVSIQSIVTFLHFFFVKDYVSSNNGEFRGLIFYSLLPFIFSILFCFLHLHLIRSALGHYLFGILSLAAQLIIWLTVITVFYKGYFPKDKIKVIIYKSMRLVSRSFYGIFKPFKSRI